jgi:hypothetical protein
VRDVYVCDFYFLLSPLRFEYMDEKPEHELWRAKIENENGLAMEGALCSAQPPRPDLIRVSATGLTEERIDQTTQESARWIALRMLTAARLCFDPALSYVHDAPYEMSVFRPEDSHPGFHIKISSIGRPWDRSLFELLIGCGDEQQIELRLLADGRDWSLPVPYRFLSFFKCLENSFRRHRSWEIAMEQHLATFEAEFAALRISNAKLFKFMLDMRDRCAHIRTGSKEVLGVLGPETVLGRKAAAALPLLDKIVSAHVERQR